MILPSSYATAAATAGTPPPAAATPPPPRPMLGPSPYAALDRPLFTTGRVTIPKNDGELRALLTQSKAVLDHQGRMNLGPGVHPAQVMAFQRARQQHIEAVVNAVQQYNEKHPTTYSQQIVDAIHSDPSLKVSHLKKKP